MLLTNADMAVFVGEPGALPLIESLRKEEVAKVARGGVEANFREGRGGWFGSVLWV